MSKQNTDTEKGILNAAKRVFQRKGMGGARMQEIADEAKINKSLLHYYYRSKQKLFEAVFKDTIFEFAVIIKRIINSDDELKVKVPQIVEAYIEYLKDRPYAVSFILNSLNSDPKILMKLIKQVNPKSLKIYKQIEQEIASGKIKAFKADHIFINVLALTIFPIVAKPIIMAGIMDNNDEKYRKFLEERKTHVVDFVFSALQVESKK